MRRALADAHHGVERGEAGTGDGPEADAAFRDTGAPCAGAGPGARPGHVAD